MKAEAVIPVELLNPGQVFACMGFLEAADVLCGDAEGGFDWSDLDNVRFRLRADGDRNPVELVLEFLAAADVESLVPRGYEQEGEASLVADAFPASKGERMALPLRVRSGASNRQVDWGHWADGSSRNSFKLFAGNRAACSIAQNILRGIRSLWEESREALLCRPFDECVPMGGSFNFDPRGAWTGIDAGYSPNTQKHRVLASPVVEALTVWGLQNARPNEHATRRVRYGAWGAFCAPLLARAALAGSDMGAIPVRRFEFVLDLSGKNKVVTFASEETS